MSLKYKILFSVEILHEYYDKDFCTDFDIIPSPETTDLLKGQRMLYRSINNKLIVLIQTDSADTPLINVEQLKKFTFYMKLKNIHFNNFTNLDYTPSQPKKYYFSNTNQTKIGSVLYLNSKIQTYAGSADYKIGSLAANASNTVFEAIKPSNNASAHALTDTNYWMSKGKFQYVNADDLTELSPYVYVFDTVAATSFEVKVFAISSSGNYDVQVMDSVNHSFLKPQTSIPIRLENLPNGKYRLEVNGASKYIYLDANALYSNILGIIEIQNNLPASNAFALLDSAGKSKALQFTLRFANRAIVWKYISLTNKVTAINDSRPAPEKYVFIPESENQFISSKPIPLKEIPLKTLSIESAALGNLSPLANPGVERLGTFVRDGNVYYSAELHLNY